MGEDYFRKISDIAKQYANSKAGSGFHIEYLEKAKEVLEIYSEANAIVEYDGARDSEELKKLYEKIKSLTNL